MAERNGKGSTILRTLAILEIIGQAGDPVSLAELAARAGLPKATAHRIALALERQGFVRREPDGRGLAVGPRLTRLAFHALGSDGRRAERRAILTDLVQRVGETCNLTGFDGHEVFYIDRVEADWPLRLHFEAGSRVPAHCTASGKLFLAFRPAAERQRLLAALPLDAHTPRTIANAATLERECQRIRTRGISTDDQEFLIGMVAVAVPVAILDGRAVAAIAIHAPVARVKLAGLVQRVPLLTRAAERLALTFDLTATPGTARRQARA
jgi:DNA-binding IclR family transcriptional regulator